MPDLRFKISTPVATVDGEDGPKSLDAINFPLDWDKIVERAGTRNLSQSLDLIEAARIHFADRRVSLAADQFRDQLEHRKSEFWQSDALVHLPIGATAIVVSDFHGSLKLLTATLKASRFFERLEAGEDIYLVLNGDTTDRGDEQIQCFEAILELCVHSKTRDRVIFLTGNHEAYHEIQAKYGLRSAVAAHEPYLESEIGNDTRLVELAALVRKSAPKLVDSPQAKLAALGLWIELNKVFSLLPLCAYSSCDVMIGHSAISQYALEGDIADKLFTVSKMDSEKWLKGEMLCAYMGEAGNDTKHIWIPVETACAWRAQFNLSLIIRGHQDSCPNEINGGHTAEQGYWWTPDGSILTVFASRSASLGSAACEVTLCDRPREGNGVKILQFTSPTPQEIWLTEFLSA